MILKFLIYLPWVEIRSLELRHLLVSSESAVKRMSWKSFFFLTMDAVMSFVPRFIEALKAQSQAATQGRLQHRYGGPGRASSSHELEVPEVR
jgi:hypothetical protein